MKLARLILVFRLVGVLLSVSCAWSATRTVNISNFAFTDTVSNNSTTTINQGDTVHWVWQSGTHSTTSGTCSGPGTCTPSKNWDSTILSSPNTFDFTFNSAGTFPYYCRVHTTAMLAKVIVNPFPVVTNTNDSGAGSLRQAILDFNANPSLTTITFNIPAAGVQTITPISALPAMTHPGILDGTSQPGWVAGTPLIELNGGSLPAGVDGLSIQGGNTTVRGFIINRFSGHGIVLESSGNTLTGNFIGTNAAGTAALANGANGVLIFGGQFKNIIGGTTAAARNIISGNHIFGIQISGVGTNGNMVEGNFIGTDLSGSVAIANGADGVRIDAGAANNFVGGAAAGAGNVISGNGGSGVMITESGTTGNTVSGNFIGTNAAGTGALGNNADGVIINSAASVNIIGGATPGTGNTISGNTGAGVVISDFSTDRNQVQGNLIGTNATGNAKIPNSDGVLLLNNAGSSNAIGGTTAGARNIISGNTTTGITMNSVSGIVVSGNFIGTDVSGATAFGNSTGVFLVNNATGNFIGGTAAGAGNVISGNSSDGIEISGTNGNVVAGNFIGTNFSGNAAIANGVGVYITSGASNNTIGTSGSGRNVISGNSSYGMLLSGTGTNTNFVLGNYIGTNASGTASLGNGGGGVTLLNGPSGNQIGVVAAGNLISGNTIDGVMFSGTGTNGNLARGNLIGTNASGTAALGNTGSGVNISGGAVSNIVGGTSAGQGNVISGNAQNGVIVFGPGSNLNMVQGNFIGTDASGTAPLGNGMDGVRVDTGVGNITGGTAAGAGNIIAFNAKGVVVVNNAAVGNAIEGNSIFSNTALGIDLNDDGVTLNTAGGPHTGPNNLQNYPVLTAAAFNGGSLSANGTLNSIANTTFRLEFFSNTACDASGHGQGANFLGSQNVTTDGGGNGTFAASFPDSIISARAISATATDPAGNTSEFSACLLADYALTNVAGRNLRVRLGQPFTLVVATFTDSDPSGNAGQFAGTTINWGDGTAPSAAVVAPTGVGQNFNVIGTHAYTKVGAWTVTVTINDSSGASATATSRARLWPKAFSF